MAKIPLRAYIKEIENLIERGEIEPAIAHARNILRAYPKSIETYRLLGKAYLESQRYGEAADILQRVLAVIPDDFVSQIGMSIIREDEGNLDAAIWHMERAYEVQPFNPAVQDELRRLYGRRDGVEPPKIRLTRGALVRMYTRGELYPQAIAETRAALAEDPQRYDLLVLLARLYYQNGQKNDAAEVCSELLAKLPYCYEANKILAEILPSTARADEAPKFLQRIYALDPYEAFLSPSAPTSAQVPDQAVMVEEFVWDADAEATQAPGWTRAAGVAWEEPEVEEKLPDWLNTLQPDAAAPTQELEAEAPTTEAEEVAAAGAMIFGAEAAETEVSEGEDLVPDWMKEAGWAPSDRSADDIMAEQAASETEEEGDIAPAEIPDWLQSLAPEEGAVGVQDEERTGWLESLLEPSDETELTRDEAAMAAIEAETPGEEELEAFTAEIGEAVEGSETQPAPEWLAELEGETLPDWLKEAEQPSAKITTEGEPVAAEEEGLPEWTSPVAAETTPPGEVEAAAEPAEGTKEEEIPDWLRTLEGESTQPESEIAGWETADATEITEGEAEEEAAEAGDLPEWLQALKAESTQAEEAEAPSMEVELPAAAVEAEQTIESAFAPGETEAAAEVQSAETIETPSAEEPAEVTSALEATSEGAPDFSDMDATMAWLEALAARQGADEATLITPPDQRTEEMPEWLQGEAAQAATTEAAIEEEAPQSEAEETPSIEAAVETPEVEVPVVDQPEAVEPVTAEVEETEEEQALPDWLADEETTAETGPAVIYEIPTPAFAASDTVIDEWTTEATEELETGLVAEEETTAEAETPLQPAAEGTMPDFNVDDAMAWLESLAARQGADEETLITPPDQRTEKPPEWVQELEPEEASFTAEEPITETSTVGESAVEGELPDWLMEEGASEVAPQTTPAAEEGGFEEMETTTAATEEEGASETGIPDWLKDIEVIPAAATFEERPEEIAEWSLEAEGSEQAAGEEIPTWLAAESGVEAGETTQSREDETIPEWLMGLEEESEALSATAPGAQDTTDYTAAWEPEITLETTAQPEPDAQVEAPSAISDLRKELDAGRLEPALDGYNRLIQNNEHLGDVISDLRNALYRYPVDISLWQTLGDAYARNNQLQEALDAYTKAEELLR